MSAGNDSRIIDEDVKVLHHMGYAQELSRTHGRVLELRDLVLDHLHPGRRHHRLPGRVLRRRRVLGRGRLADRRPVRAGGRPRRWRRSPRPIPTAGGLYHWASILGGRGYGWVCAWINLLGLVFVVASVNVGVYLLFKDLVLAGVFGMDTSGWGYQEQVIAVSLITVTPGAVQSLRHQDHDRDHRLLRLPDPGRGRRVDPDLPGLGRHLRPLAPDASSSTTPASRAAGSIVEPRTAFVAFLVGLLYPIYTITGFDASAHTSEETIDARRQVPRGILHSIFWSLAFGLVMAISFVLAIPDLAAAAKDGANAWFNLFNNLPAPELLKDLLAIGIVVANYCCALAGLTSISRMVFAFSRDGGLPASSILRKVSPVHRTPVAAIWTSAVLSVAATLYSPAFAALAAGCAMFLYISYAMPIAAGLVAEGKTWTEFGPFRLGIWSKPVAVLSLIGVVLVAYAGIQPPFDILINYAVGLLDPAPGDLVRVRAEAFPGAADRRRDRQAAGGDPGRRAGGRRSRALVEPRGVVHGRRPVFPEPAGCASPPSTRAPPARGCWWSRTVPPGSPTASATASTTRSPAGSSMTRWSCWPMCAPAPRRPGRWRRSGSTIRARAASPGTPSPASRCRRSSSGRTTAPARRSSGCGRTVPRR